MVNKDICKKYLAHNDSVRVVICDVTNMIKEIREIHNLSNTTTVAIGRTIAITSIMSSLLEEENSRLSIQISGDGPISNIITCSNNNLEIKGYVSNPQVELKNIDGKYNVAGAIGKGILTVIKDIGLKEPYIGKCNLITSEIAEDFAYYYLTSEQTPSIVSLGVNLDKDGNILKASGYFIQPLPDCSDNVINILEKANVNIKSVTSMMLDLDNMLDVAKLVTSDENVKEIYSKVPKLVCDCNDIRIKNAIISMGYDEAVSALKENNGIIEVKCSFCNKSYKFNDKNINELFGK
jgi:molecular chaperone Hsp33